MWTSHSIIEGEEMTGGKSPCGTQSFVQFTPTTTWSPVQLGLPRGRKRDDHKSYGQSSTSRVHWRFRWGPRFSYSSLFDHGATPPSPPPRRSINSSSGPPLLRTPRGDDEPY
ncbi:hypothetical protein BHE74_00039705 [Ensete ventricosum]|nr:hypothetical protein BHE74_00039705 [Ensete ventricosum]